MEASVGFMHFTVDTAFSHGGRLCVGFTECFGEGRLPFALFGERVHNGDQPTTVGRLFSLFSSLFTLRRLVVQNMDIPSGVALLITRFRVLH
jgi:hypothetical protein